MKKLSSVVSACWPFVSPFSLIAFRQRKKIQWMAMLVVACVGGGLVLPAPLLRAQDKNQRDVIRRARASYYSLKGRGLVSFQCQVVPDWDALFLALNPGAGAQDPVLQLLKQTRFQVAIGPTGASTVSHQSDYAPPNEQIAARVRQTTSGLEQTITGFFNIWSPFTFGSPFPDAESEFQLEDLAGQYRLTYKQGTAQVVTTMTGDYAMTETTFKSPQINMDFHPEWSRVNGVYILSAFKASYSAAPAGTQELEGKFTYQEVDGLELPMTLDVKVVTPARTVALQITFAGCRVTKQ